MIEDCSIFLIKTALDLFLKQNSASASTWYKMAILLNPKGRLRQKRSYSPLEFKRQGNRPTKSMVMLFPWPGRYWADKAPTSCWTASTCCIEHTQPITVGHLLLSWANNKKNDFPGEPEFDQVQSLIQLWCHEGPRDAFLCPTYSAVDEDVSKGALLACWLASQYACWLKALSLFRMLDRVGVQLAKGERLSTLLLGPFSQASPVRPFFQAGDSLIQRLVQNLSLVMQLIRSYRRLLN